MSKLIVTLIIASSVLGCTQSEPNRAVQKENDYKRGPYYFKKAEKVDNDKFGPHTYRLENEEVICYSGGNEQGLQCKWKVQQ